MGLGDRALIALRVECDVPGCGRHCVIPEHELAVFPAATVKMGRAGVMIEESEVPLPDGWMASGDNFGFVTVLCTSHAAR